MGNFIDMVGMKFGSLEVIEKTNSCGSSGDILWKCKCICGKTKVISGASLRNGNTKTCGCRFKDIAGMKSGELTAIKYLGIKNRNSIWLCKCSCGGEKEVSATKIRTKIVTSCGCKKGRHSHGLANTRIYNIWNCMKQRCNNKNFKDYSIYGGRGISYCEKWETFEGFYEDMSDIYIKHIEEYGNKNTTLDRINYNGNYCKENCRWATLEEQSYNKRDNIYIECDGEKLRPKEISLKYNLPISTVYSRYEKGERGSNLIRPRGTKKQI